MWISFFNSPDPAVFTWASTVTLASMQNALAPGSPAEFIDNISGSRILMGTHSGEDMTFTPSTGAYQRSIHMGLGGNDLFNISANNNTQDLYDGGEGADRFVVSSDGGDKIYGGAGTDTIDFTNFATGIFLSISGTGTYNTAPISFRSVENVIGTAQADTFVFSTIAQGTDLLSIDGGAGLDTIVLSGAAPADDSSLRSIDLMLGVMGDVLSITNIENVTGGVADDLIYGNALANRLLGEAGNDHIEGMDGNDIIGGGNGDDVIHGGHGNDTIWGDHGTSFGDDVIHGGAGKDVIYAGDGKDMLYGDEDNDNIYGDAGDDYIDGGAGSDNLHGNAGNDVIRGGSGTNRLYGEEGNDDLLGGNGMDTVNGGSDDDRLNGGGSHDYLIGGAGADVFCFGSGRDVAEDFTLGQDRLFRDGNFSVSYTQWDVGVRVLSSDQSSYILLNGIDLQDLLVYENNDLLWS